MEGILKTVSLPRGRITVSKKYQSANPSHAQRRAGFDIVQVLLNHGAEINSVAGNGQTPLAEAMRGKHEELAAWMKAKGAVIGVQPDGEELKK